MLSAQYDPATNQLILFGGVDATGAAFGDAWVLSNANGLGGTPQWTQLTPTGGPPAARGGYSAGYSAATGRMVVALGVGGGQMFNDVWVLALDSTPPTVTITTPAAGTEYTLGSTVFADYACDDTGGSGLVSCSGSVPDGAAIDTGSIGSKSFTVNAADGAGNTRSVTYNYKVVYDFSGFFEPVNNLPVLNGLKAGAAVPLKFSLDGDQGLGIFESGYPKSHGIVCSSSAPTDGVEETVTAGASGLSYDPATYEYTYVWKTAKAWAGTCRQLVLQLTDGTYQRVNFEFK